LGRALACLILSSWLKPTEAETFIYSQSCVSDIISCIQEAKKFHPKCARSINITACANQVFSVSLRDITSTHYTNGQNLVHFAAKVSYAPYCFYNRAKTFTKKVWTTKQNQNQTL